MRTRLAGLIALTALGCARPQATSHQPPASSARTADPSIYWNSASIYFLLTDRFNNADSTNDTPLGRRQDGAVLRSYMGGDLKGVKQKIDEGYFDSLGIDAIWMTPFVEQVRGSVDEGTGKTYGYHGYWTRDWTSVDPNLGTVDDLKALVQAAHRHGIRVLMDAVVNHTGPRTSVDPRWPEAWVRRTPNCNYQGYASTVTCNLVDALPDILTESDTPVELPPTLAEKWRAEGRLEAEQRELDEFFRRTGYPRAPRYYVIKWLTDWVREIGFDGYRVDTAKHFEETASATLRREADIAFADWKRAHPAEVLDSLPFYMVGEVYGFGVGDSRQFNFGDRSVDFFNFGYDALINFAFVHQARAGRMDSIANHYSRVLHGPLRGVSVLNYIDSHDDGNPLDPDRTDAINAGNKLLLALGTAQVYYGDETARVLRMAGSQGDANLRTFMNWGDIQAGGRGADVLRHWRALARFRRAHPAVGAGEHHTIQAQPWIFARTLDAGQLHDKVVVALDQGAGAKTIPVGGTFADGTALTDAYSGTRATVSGGNVTLTTSYPTVLLSEARP